MTKSSNPTAFLTSCMGVPRFLPARAAKGSIGRLYRASYRCGVTRNLSISARVSVNGTSMRSVGEFFIRQSDYEIQPVTAAGGAIRLKDELKVAFDITARKQA